MKKIITIILSITIFIFNSDVYAKQIEFVNKEQNVYVGSTTKLEIIYNESLQTENDYIWESSNESIATVTDGEVKALKPGIVTITISNQDGTEKSEIELSVLEKKQELSIDIEGYNLKFNKNKYNYTLVIGKEKKLNINVSPSDQKYTIVGNKDLKNGSIITISLNGIKKPYIINIKKKESLIIYFIIIISILLFLNIIRMIIKNKKI